MTESQGDRDATTRGRLDGLRDALAMIIEERFSITVEDTDGRIAAADEETLVRWLERALVVSEFAEVMDALATDR